MIDFAESVLFKAIQGGSLPATIFFLKTQGYARGYVERLQIDGNVSIESVNKVIAGIVAMGNDPAEVFDNMVALAAENEPQ